MEDEKKSIIIAKTIGVGIRWALTIFITWNIWLHSHWSVALSITLMTLNFEIIAQNKTKVFKS